MLVEGELALGRVQMVEVGLVLVAAVVLVEDEWW